MKTNAQQTSSSYERARRKVDDIKGFYGHLLVYLFVNGVLLFTREDFNFLINGDSAFGNSNFMNWLNWETYGTPIFWGIALAFHALSVFGRNPFLGKKWEERQLRKLLEKDKLD